MKRGIIRVILVNFLSVSLLFWGGFSFFSAQAQPSLIIKEEKPQNVNSVPQEKEEKKPETQENSSEKETSETQTSEVVSSEEATETSAEAIKGQIISQYNSPYLAPSSYNGVYLKNNSGLDISIKNYLEGKINFKIKKNSEPQVLILHTHATETFKTDDKDYFTDKFSSRSNDTSQNMVSVGKIVAERLNANGIKTLHDKTLHDYPSYSKSYSRSAATVKEYLKKYPTIKVVIDLHRDAVTKENGDKVKLVTEIGGKKAAQVMLVMGSQSGGITNFPKWEENFKLAVNLQQTIEKKYPTLARPLMLMSKTYNQNLTTGSLLIEVGTDANTLTEVHYSAEMIGDSLAELLSTLA